MSADHSGLLDATMATIVRALARKQGRGPLVSGLCGAQGSGKSTLAAALRERCEKQGIPTAILSLDDLYKRREARERLARTVHPLFLTRGVPGTHDVSLGLALFDALDKGLPAAFPRFDKSVDDRADRVDMIDAGVELVIFEGWCVGARPQAEAALLEPVNALERIEDPDGTWRIFANRALAGEYQQLFARIDQLNLLAAPNFGIVRDWRTEQERQLRQNAAAVAHGVMSDAQLSRFVQHYERLTRHILEEMPQRAGLVAWLNSDRSPRQILVHDALT